MNHRPDIEELLVDYIDGTLDPARKQEVESILASDPELRKSVQQMMLGRDALKSLPIEKTPAHVTEAITQTIAAPAPHRWLLQFSAAKLAASLLLTVTLAIIVWSILPRDQRSPVAADIQARPSLSLADRNSLDKDDESDLAAPMAKADAMAKSGPMGAGAPAPLAAGPPAEGTFASAGSNASALMYVRASDIPAVQREIAQLVTSNRITQAASNAAETFYEKAAPPMRKEADAAEAKAEKPAAPTDSVKSLADAKTPAKSTILLSNVTSEQVLQIQQNVTALSPSNRVEIVAPDQNAQAQAEFRMQEQQAPQQQQQMLRSMPSAPAEELEQFGRMRQQRELRQAQQPRDSMRYDLTIILEPQPAAGPGALPAARPATLPSTAPARP